MNVLTVFIENEEFYVVDKVVLNNSEYYYLISVLDESKFMIRKIEKKDGKEYLVGLEDENEFYMVLLYLKIIFCLIKQEIK